MFLPSEFESCPKWRQLLAKTEVMDVARISGLQAQFLGDLHSS